MFRVRYNALHWDGAAPNGAILFGQRNDVPDWILDDETPGTYGGSEGFEFLLQTRENYRFSPVPDAPRQMLPNYTGTGGPLAASLVDKYDLWAANAAYFFITPSRKILAVVQSD